MLEREVAKVQNQEVVEVDEKKDGGRGGGVLKSSGC